ncbi:lysophospholipid acyltransferase family protein [Cellulomonas bogoriensis]|uniref:Acyl-phosphate glycerol 3-phosphate acyltransferase n=1 Tax=Cellulomonas bogoriensis 69B4 = DSM 16987 TaxID=1386082 RepID=A0A0A0C2U5_9CELL|nr:lysophospholipid acyltransferase family protein [Cellulomonas bogoriensis]KGM14506.1 acyl-phosphate glycerol 3-phosphate acyltransferase [Cellulomonas bogoriensis 69B4 = DSM 16987]
MRAGPQAPGAGGPRRSRWLGWFLARVVWRTTVIGADRVPRTGQVLLAANHLGLVDGPVVHGCAPRPTHLLVKHEMFRGPVGWLLRSAGQIPVDRENGRPALSAALGVLRRGGAVGIFPEGERGRGDAATARAGVAWLAVTSGAPVVPVAVLGTRRTGEPVGRVPGVRRRLVVAFGEPVTLTGGGPVRGRAAVQRANEQLRTVLAAHVAATSAATGVALPTDAPFQDPPFQDAPA